jgi:hypothetical protein
LRRWPTSHSVPRIQFNQTRGDPGHESRETVSYREAVAGIRGGPAHGLRTGAVIRHSGLFFPAWLVCLAAGLLLTVVFRWLLLRIQIVIAAPVLTYPSLTALITLALWLAFFR